MVDGSTQRNAAGTLFPRYERDGAGRSARRRTIGPAYGRMKLTWEWLAALAMLVAAAPLMAALAVALKLTSQGPVIYSQVRLGRDGRRFRIHKFRTMAHHCEAKTGPVWSLAGDPRVTRVGRWLRDTHLDELPQLWNVLRGDMSLIGPRPERPEIAEQIERALPAFRERLRVRPGITGLAQMRLPADSSLDTAREKLAHDLRYVENIGIGLDARIAVSTALHFVGWAATAVSRGLVARFAPEPTLRPTVVARPGLMVAGREIDTEGVRIGVVGMVGAESGIAESRELRAAA